MRLMFFSLLSLSAFAKRLSLCQQEKDARCFKDGRYYPIQKSGSSHPQEFVCVTEWSGYVRFNLGQNKGSRKCTHKNFIPPNKRTRPCDHARYQTILQHEREAKPPSFGFVMDLIPMKCTADGKFEHVQHHPLTGEFIVNVETGKILPRPVNFLEYNTYDECVHVSYVFPYSRNIRKIRHYLRVGRADAQKLRKEALKMRPTTPTNKLPLKYLIHRFKFRDGRQIEYAVEGRHFEIMVVCKGDFAYPLDEFLQYDDYDY